MVNLTEIDKQEHPYKSLSLDDAKFNNHCLHVLLRAWVHYHERAYTDCPQINFLSLSKLGLINVKRNNHLHLTKLACHFLDGSLGYRSKKHLKSVFAKKDKSCRHYKRVAMAFIAISCALIVLSLIITPLVLIGVYKYSTIHAYTIFGASMLLCALLFVISFIFASKGSHRNKKFRNQVFSFVPGNFLTALSEYLQLQNKDKELRTLNHIFRNDKNYWNYATSDRSNEPLSKKIPQTTFEPKPENVLAGTKLIKKSLA